MEGLPSNEWKIKYLQLLRSYYIVMLLNDVIVGICTFYKIVSGSILKFISFKDVRNRVHIIIILNICVIAFVRCLQIKTLQQLTNIVISGKLYQAN